MGPSTTNELCDIPGAAVGTVDLQQQPQPQQFLESSDIIALRGKKFIQKHSNSPGGGVPRKKSYVVVEKTNSSTGINTDLSFDPGIGLLLQSTASSSKLARPAWPRSSPTIPATFYKDSSGRSVRRPRGLYVLINKYISRASLIQ